MKKRPTILTIAGFDPSSGAGLTADLKTFESLRVYGMAVQTANTIQTDSTFLAVNWVDESIVFSQLETLLKEYQFDAVKVGLIPSFSFLKQALKRIRTSQPNVLVVWDPILATSTNFDFEHKNEQLIEALELVDWVTPNWNEIKRLSKNENALEGAKYLSQFAKIYLKGGHNEVNIGKDYLVDQNQLLAFNAKAGTYYEKHGSGCVFSAALTAHLVQGYTPQKAVLKSKRLIEHFLKSNSSKLGYHFR